jgi:hypothetical protein
MPAACRAQNCLNPENVLPRYCYACTEGPDARIISPFPLGNICGVLANSAALATIEGQGSLGNGAITDPLQERLAHGPRC